MEQEHIFGGYPSDRRGILWCNRKNTKEEMDRVVEIIRKELNAMQLLFERSHTGNTAMSRLQCRMLPFGAQAPSSENEVSCHLH